MDHKWVEIGRTDEWALCWCPQCGSLRRVGDEVIRYMFLGDTEWGKPCYECQPFWEHPSEFNSEPR
jgi:hypothetical protein